MLHQVNNDKFKCDSGPWIGKKIMARLKFTDRTPCPQWGHQRSQSEGQKEVNTDVIWMCLGEWIIIPFKCDAGYCIDKKLQAVLKFSNRTQCP